MSRSAAQFIDEKGGSAAVAEATGKSVGAVRVWKHRNILPRDAWPELMKAYEDTDLDALLAIESAGHHATGSAASAAKAAVQRLDVAVPEAVSGVIAREREKPKRCVSTHGSADFAVTEGQPR